MGISCGIFENLRIDANENKDDMKVSDVRVSYHPHYKYIRTIGKNK